MLLPRARAGLACACSLLRRLLTLVAYHSPPGQRLAGGFRVQNQAGSGLRKPVLEYGASRTNAMNDTTIDADQIDDDILTYEVSDEALEAAAARGEGRSNALSRLADWPRAG
jgi:hypothetical protein